MSVQTEISRLESAKEAIATAIAGKGVTVPAGTMLDGMAALIESIEAGGGGSENTYQVARGSFSVTATTTVGKTLATVTGLPFTPKEVWMYNKNSVSTKSGSFILVLAVTCEDGTLDRAYVQGNTTTTYGVSGSNDFYALDITSDGFVLSKPGSTSYGAKTSRFSYIAIG